MQSWLRILLITALIGLLAALDAAFFPSLGNAARHISMTLIASLYTVVILQERMALLIFVLATLLIGFTVSTSIILPLVLGLFSLSLVNVLFMRFFTNRSYYTLLTLGAIGWLAYYLLFDGLRMLFRLISSSDQFAPNFDARWAVSLLAGFFVLIASLTVAYVLTVFFSKRFRSYFIVSGRNL